MPQMILDFTVEQAQRMAAAFGTAIPPGDTPATAAQVEAQIKHYIKQRVLAHEREAAIRAVEESVADF
jgi:hypothetical protein